MSETTDVGHVHVLTRPGGPCRDDCPHAVHHYTCAVCGNTFRKGWTDEEAAAEAAEVWPDGVGDDAASVCDGCYVQVMSWALSNPPFTATLDLDPAAASGAACEVGKAYGVPMSLIDGRPWVPTEEEANAEYAEAPDLDLPPANVRDVVNVTPPCGHDPLLWGGGLGAGCGHPDHEGTTDA